MQNKKVVGIGLGVVVALVLAGGGVLLAKGHHSLKKVVDDGAGSLNAADINANRQQPTSGDSSLSVGSVGSEPTAKNLGQLSIGQQSGAAGPAAGASSSSTGPQAPDPSTFAQYDKYKEGTNALYGDIQVGTGTTLGANQKAAVYYKGWLTNGQLFDQSRAGSDGKLQPFVFTLGEHKVIPGWEQAIAGMKVGGTRLLIVPPAVGYGAQGQAPIPGNAVLVFEVQLLAMQ